MGIAWQLYPEDIITNPGKPYVYFNSLSNEILDKVAKYFNQDITGFTDADSGLSSVEQAFSFLKTVITNERAKEEAFLQYLKTKTESLNLQVPSLESNWADFVKEIQQKLDFGNLGLRDLKNEFNRLNQNKKNLEEEKQNYFGNIEVEKDALTKTQDHLEKLIESLTSKHNYNTILSTILNRYGPSLLQHDGKELIFDDTELMAMILAISTEVSKSFTSTHFQEKGVQLNQKTLNQAIDDTEVDRDIELFISNAKKMPWIRENLINSFNLGKYATHRKIKASNFFQEGNQIITNTKSISEHIYSLFNDFKFPKEAIKIIHTNDQMAEIESLVKFTVSGAIMGENTGSRGGKADNIIGYVTIDPERINILEKDSTLLSKLKEMNDLTRQLIATTSQENTADYYKRQGYNWNETAQKIDSLLKDIEKEYHILGSCFLIEDSTKNYLSLYAAKGHESTHGGSLGANLADQLNKIETLTIHGGISMVDKQWLTAAIINAGPDMIAENQKNKLQNYLAMFAAILLFDSQVNIADEALQMNLSNINTNTHLIHLFSVNNGYYPLSYVLKLTYDSLNTNLERIKSETISYGVEVSFHGFVKPPSKHYKGNTNKEQWDSLAQNALNSTKIKMKFLVSLMNILQNLLPE